MAPKFTEKEWVEDFKGFVENNEALVPEALSQKILNYVRKDLNPSPWLVFGKIAGIHAAIGTVSLSFCDQFGMNPFSTSFSLSEYFMRFGHSVCMALCGFVFLSLSIFFAWFALRPEELKVLRKNIWIQLPSLAFLSLAAFWILGAEIVFGIGLIWFVGAMMGGATALLLSTRRIVHA